MEYYDRPEHSFDSGFEFEQQGDFIEGEESEWMPHAPLITGSPISSVAFDTYEELLWAGAENGRCTSYFNPGFNKFSSYMSSASPVLQMTPDPFGILSLSSSSLRAHTRGGAPQATFTNPEFSNLLTFCFQGPTSTRHAFLGSSTGHSFLLDLSTGKIVQKAEEPEGICVAKSLSRYIVCGGTNGTLSFRDPRTMRVEGSFTVHTGTFSDLDAKNDLVVTCGFSGNRHGHLYTDPIVKIFDVRAMRQLGQFVFAPGPAILKFHPMFSSLVLAVSQSGSFEMRDTQGDLAVSLRGQIDGGAMVTCCDIASSGEAIAFGDATGLVHMWSKVDDFVVNTASQPTILPSAVPLAASSSSTLALPGATRPKPYNFDFEYKPSFIPPDTYAPSDSPPLSQWPVTITWDNSRAYAQPPREITPQILRGLKQVDFVGYATNVTGIHKPLDGYVARPAASGSAQQAAPMKQGLGALPQRPGGVLPLSSAHQSSDLAILTGAAKSVIPPEYEFHECKPSRIGWDDFDFTKYNQTAYPGLENTLPNSYTNGFVQVLYHLPPARAAIKCHLCKRHHCLACELGFLFHMFDSLVEDPSRGRTCQPSNFLRAFRQIKKAGALGLFVGFKTPAGDVDLTTRMQSFTRFILDHLHRETSSQPQTSTPSTSSSSTSIGHMFSSLNLNRGAASQPAFSPPTSASELESQYFGASSETTTSQLSTQSTQPSQTVDFSTLIPPLPPNASSDVDQTTSVLKDLFGCVARTSTKCMRCGTVVSTRETQAYSHDMPPFGATSTQQTHPTFLDLLQRSLAPETRTRTWCDKCGKYTNAEQSRSLIGLPNVLTINTPLGEEDVRWMRGQSVDEKGHLSPKLMLPQSFAASFEVPSLRINVTAEPPSSATPFTQIAEYELRSVLSVVRDPVSQGAHIVVHIKVDQGLKNKEGGSGENDSAAAGSSGWYLFNDFSVHPAALSDVLDCSQSWKVPCVLVYARKRLEEVVAPMPFVNPVTDLVYLEETSPALGARSHHSFTPLRLDELPKRGDIVAMDAEFVSLSPEESEYASDGTRVVTKASVLSPARVSVLRPQGTPFIDDYILTMEPVADYLTRYSGVKQGDLDPAVSTHHVTTLKSAYLKLRWLADRGVMFVGHGLEKDFRIMNMVVPKEQIIDTVELFHYEGKRKISLRFLAHHLLRMEIQQETHCSVEDARTALSLYVKYMELQASGLFEPTLEELYVIGRRTNWQTTGLPPQPLPGQK